MSRYMCDTNTVSHIIKGHKTVGEHLRSVAMERLCISAITEGELQFGCAKKPAAKRLHQLVAAFLSRVSVLPWDPLAASSYGLLRVRQEEMGKSLGPLDMLIAAHALSAKAVLVSNDQAFRFVDGLKLEDWCH